VSTVAVDLASGRVTVTGVGYTDDQVRAAVAEAGYELKQD
jgi:copper chaperone CopZ